MILFNDFKAHYAAVRDEVEPAVQRVLASGWYVLGEEVAGFEQAFATWLNVPFSVAVGSGTDAIALALMAVDVGPGDEVITTAMTAYPTITAIKQTGATPVVVDIEPDTGLMDVQCLEQAIGPKVKAIVPVHLYGQSCHLQPILDLAASHHIEVIEDCAQSVGATYQGKFTGAWGRFGAFSFYPSKNLGAFGDGGAVTVTNEADRDRLLMLRNYGQSKRYYHDVSGINSRLDEMQAAVLQAKLPLLSAWTARRRAIAARYRTGIVNSAIQHLQEHEYGEAVYHLFPVKLAEREAFMAHMRANDVSTLIHYPVPIHHQRDFNGRQGSACGHTEAFAEQVVSLPIYPELTDAQVDAVCDAANSYRIS